MSCVFLAATLLVGCASNDRPQPAATEPAQTREPEAHYRAREHVAEYAGPGRETPPPENPSEVRIGWFGPSDPNDPTAGDMWGAATLAVEQANAAGGCDGVPFRLVTCWSENPWGTGIACVTRLAYQQQVWAIAGAPDGPSAHLVEQVVAKARLPFVSPVATDKTANLANVPWIFSCAPGDHLLVTALAPAVADVVRRGRLAIVSSTDHDSRLFSLELMAALNELKSFPALHLEFRQESGGFSTQLESLSSPPVDAIVLVAGPEEAARFLVALRSAGLTMPVFCGPRAGQRRFKVLAGDAAEGVVYPQLWDPDADRERSWAFAQHYRQRFNREPDYTAAHSYDAVNLVIEATRRAGLNRVRISDELRALSSWPGVSGVINWDATGQNTRAVGLSVHGATRRPPAPARKTLSSEAETR